jgi:virginiamycin B lyase
MRLARFMTIGRPARSRAAGRSRGLIAGALAVVAACVVPAPASAAVMKIFALPPSLKSPDQIAVGPDGALWFTQDDEQDKRKHSVLGRMTTVGDASAVAVPAGSQPRALTPGPDGALWYAADGTNVGRLGRVTPAGIEELLLPRGAESANGIVTGADGALWFTNGARIGRLVPGAPPTFIPIPDAESSLQQIIADPNGDLWFTLESTIGRITPAGTLSTFRLPRAARFTRDIALTADGALWFTSYDDPGIGRIALDGHIRMYDLPERDLPGAITVGPDHAIWFIGLSTIERITAHGDVTELRMPDPDLAFDRDLTSGPDGAIWFTRQIAKSDDDLGSRSGAIGRIPVAGRQLLTARLTTDSFRARHGRLLRISFTATRKASGVVQVDRAGLSYYHPDAKRAVHAHTGANSVTLRLPRRPGSYRLVLRLQVPTQTAIDTARLTITR